MSDLVKEFLQSWEAELFLPRPNDPLIHLHTDSYILEANALWTPLPKSKNIWRELKRIERERGVVPLVQFEGLLSWQRANKSVQTPVFLTSCKAIKHATQHIELEDQIFLNPFLGLLLQKNGLQLPEAADQKTQIEQLLKCGLFTSYEPVVGFANLHPQRYELRKEWEGLASSIDFSPAIHQIIGDNDQPVLSLSRLSTQQISPLDPDQLAAIEQLKSGSTVIYGPPGTGKSVVLSNVVSSALSSSQNVLVLAEKMVALEVLIQKLKEVGLQHFCVLIDEQTGSNHFYKRLQAQFEKLLQRQFDSAIKGNLQPFKAAAYWQQRQTLEQLAQCRLPELLATFQTPTKTKGLPTRRWIHWLAAKDELRNLPLSLAEILPVLTPTWQEARMQENSLRFEEWKTLYALLAPHQIDQQKTLDSFVEKSLRCIQFQAQVYQKYLPLLDANTSLLRTKLLRYQQYKKEEERLEKCLQVWIQIPTQVEWAALNAAAKQHTWLQKRRWRKLEKNWLRTANLALNELEKDLKKYWRNAEQLAQIGTYFSAYGVLDLDNELGVLLSLLQQQQQESWNWYRSLNQHEIEKYCHLHKTAHQFQQLQQQLFKPCLLDFQTLSERLDKALKDVGTTNSALQQISPELWSLADQPDLLQAELTQEFWADLRHHFPAVYDCYWAGVEPDFDADLTIEASVWMENSRQICSLQQQRFDQLQALLEAPVYRLSPSDKERRQLLRKGKAILVKEMAKTRQHLSLRALFDGPAREWLRVIFPVWLASPTALAKALPLQTDLFDIGIFDEASQLPLSHAVGALQRVNQIVVAGDPQQMRPQSYFGQSAEGVVDLLHQAAFYLPRRHLRHHYRSEDPALIAFSNRKFYNNELFAWPAAAHPENGIFAHYIADGIYAEQQNQKEAKALAKQLHALLQKQSTIGVVAFSQTQLLCIHQHLSVADQVLLEERISEGSAFFLPLEQVQGEECDQLLISFGYANNENGQFSLRLGPMVQSQSGRRLNVLLTRAKKALHFYCSVRAADFPSKKSPAVQLLWEWFDFIENGDHQQALHLAEERLASAPNYATFLNYYRVLKQRRALPNRV